jgi:hypothetical protein
MQLFMQLAPVEGVVVPITLTTLLVLLEAAAVEEELQFMNILQQN